jgi:hypothetical protein
MDDDELWLSSSVTVSQLLSLEDDAMVDYDYEERSVRAREKKS